MAKCKGKFYIFQIKIIFKNKDKGLDHVDWLFIKNKNNREMSFYAFSEIFTSFYKIFESGIKHGWTADFYAFKSDIRRCTKCMQRAKEIENIIKCDILCIIINRENNLLSIFFFLNSICTKETNLMRNETTIKSGEPEKNSELMN